RDFHVTGVQTCALPIYQDERKKDGGADGKDSLAGLARRLVFAEVDDGLEFQFFRAAVEAAQEHSGEAMIAVLQCRPDVAAEDARSEERRVGEGGRARRE